MTSLNDLPELRDPEDNLEARTKEAESSATDNGSITLAGINEVEKRMVVERFIKRTRVMPVKGTNMVRISFDSTDPVIAASVSNKITETYIASYTESRVEMAENANIQLNERLNYRHSRQYQPSKRTGNRHNHQQTTRCRK